MLKQQKDEPNKLLLKPSQTHVAEFHTHLRLMHEINVKLIPMTHISRSLILMLTSNKFVGVRSLLNL